MNAAAQKKLQDELQNSTSVKHALDILAKYYDVENCKPSSMMRQIVMPQIVKGMTSLGAKARREYA